MTLKRSKAPPGYDHSGKRRFPVLYDLVGFTGSGLAHANWKPVGDNVPERAARLVREQKMESAIIVFPDCLTALGSNDDSGVRVNFHRSSAVNATLPPYKLLARRLPEART